jgi:hypothetical protein
VTQTGGQVVPTTGSAGYSIAVIHPETVLTKTANPAAGSIPLKVTYTFTEKNVSTDPTPTLRAKDVITTVAVTDTTGCSPTFKTSSGGTPPATTAKLQVGATWTYTCSQTFSTAGSFTDHAVGTGVAGDRRQAGTPASLGAPANETAQATVTTLGTRSVPIVATTPQPATAVLGSTTLNDKVTLADLVNPVTGTGAGRISVKLYPPSNPTCTGTAIFTDVITAKTGNGTYTTSGGPTANADGIWHWTAAYSGDNSNNPVISGCAEEPVIIRSPSSPAFVIGDIPAGEPTIGNYVNFWGSQWSKENVFSDGKAPTSMKGYADNVSELACGNTYTTSAGNSSVPPLTTPSTIEIIVSSKVTKSGAVISGNIAHLVIVHVAPGYSPAPGHSGWGNIVRVVC